MGRWIYTDPLAAAWMSKHFGMRFGQIVNKAGFGQLSRNDGGAFAPRYIEQLDYGDAQRFYLHPDSLHLLEPQIGDFARDNYLLIQVVEDDEADDEFLCTAAEAAAMMAKRSHGAFEIIQRNGTAFMWPEREP